MSSSLCPPEPLPPNEDPDADRIVCFCHNVKFLEIQATCRRGKLTLAEIQAETKASTGCGGCEWEVREILEDALSKVEDFAKKS